MNLSPFALLCTAGLFAIFSSTISKSPVLPLFASHLGAGPEWVGFVASVSAFTGIIGSVPAGVLSDRFGRRRMLLVSSFVFATAPFLYLLVSSLWQLALIRFYHGFATALFIPVAMALVADLFQSGRGERMGWFSTATLAGRFMAPLVGGSIIGALAFNPGLGYKTVYTVCGGTGAAVFVAVLMMPGLAQEDPGSRSWGQTFGTFRSVLMKREILVTGVVEASILFAYGTFETFLPLFAIGKGFSAFAVGIFLSAQVITLAFAKPVMGRFSDRHGRKPQIFFGALAGAVCIGCLSLISSFPALLALSILFGFSLSVVTSATSAFIADTAGKEARGSAMGILGSVMDIGHTTGPLVSGFVAASFGYPRAFAGASMVVALIALLFLCTVGMRREDPAA